MSEVYGTEVTLVSGDKVTIDFIIKDINGSIQDLTNFSPLFKYRKYDDTTVGTIAGTVVIPGTDGRVRFSFDLSGTSFNVGDYDCEVQLTSIDLTQIITCPDLVLHILEEL